MSEDKSSELSTDDIQSEIAERGDDGELLAETHEIDWFGEEREIDTKPITTGVLNELSHVDEEIANLKPEAVHEAFQTIYLTESITELTVEDIRDIKAGALQNILEPLEEEVNGNFGDDSGNPAEMSKSERAKEMRS